MMHRRSFLQQTSCGFGALAMAAMIGEQRRGVASPLASPLASPIASPLAARAPHGFARAKRILFLFMQGGVSQVDSFDPKPLLAERDGQMHAFDDARALANTGQRGGTQRIMKSPWEFSQYGASGTPVSQLFPHLARHVDDLCFVHSLHTDGVAHGPATLFLHCGSTNSVRPSLGAWVTYGLGTENGNLPAFVTIAPSSGNGGSRNYGSAFLPALYQGTPVGKAGSPAAHATIRNLGDSRRSESVRRRQFDLLQALNRAQMSRHGRGDPTQTPSRATAEAAGVDDALEATIHSYELAWRMQTMAPDVLHFGTETAATLEQYGIGKEPTDNFGRQCLMARRLCESGVRFVQVTYGDNSANPAWDQHSNLPKHADHAQSVDQPIAALLQDLKQRGMLEDTLVWWGGEFGRTPYAEKNGTGRDHNPGGFTIWLAGGGTQPGLHYGSTDEFGHLAVSNRVHMHDLHATLLCLLGLDHEQLTYRHAGRDFRLTDVHGQVVRSLIH